ncbi:hypothetical protein BDN72DRAFT_844551 [Pluteus cervinus]|uniref:Uncharacterized protein n=1 Tax=Pluteus cervinus TaxID=181527 RepID=A0ACD3AL55_9AGAR|nr:hypothetical protein BDN72DRAFT_844551 [Pluteus cervinus]
MSWPVAELCDHVVGPIPPQRFLDEFLPLREFDPYYNVTKIEGNISQSMGETINEASLCTEWIAAPGPYCGEDSQVEGHAEGILEQQDHPFGPGVAFNAVPQDRPDPYTFIRAGVIITFKLEQSDDPFDEVRDIDCNVEGAEKTLDYIAGCATTQLATDSRTHIFSMLVLPSYARLLRWDHTGAIVTGTIDLSGSLIQEFFLRLRCSSPRLRGVKDSNVPVTFGEVDLGMEFISRGEVDDDTEMVDPDVHKASILEDWTMSTPLEGLADENHTYVDSSALEGSATVESYTHHTVTLDSLDERLVSCTVISEVVTAIRDAAEAVARTADLGGPLIHRDAGYSNIAVKRNNGTIEVFLIDWDTLGMGHVIPERLGSWYFAAARLLLRPIHDSPIIPNHLDAIESLFHVLVYMASHYTDNTWNYPWELTCVVENYFKSTDTDAGQPCGKRLLFYRQRCDFVERLRNEPLKKLINGLISPITTRFHPSKPDSPATSNDLQWFSNTLTIHLDHYSMGWGPASKLTPQKMPPRPPTGAWFDHRGEALRAMRNISRSEQDYRRAQKEKRKAEKRKAEFEAHPGLLRCQKRRKVRR